jgi:outer membrane protein TolC
LSIGYPIGGDASALDDDIFLSQTVEMGDKIRQRVRSARAERNAALAARGGTVLDLTYSTRVAYYEALRSDKEMGLLSAALENARAFVKAADTQFQAGDVARSNVVRSRIELARAEQALNAAETDRANRYVTLRSLVGLPEQTTLALADNLDFLPVSYPVSELQALALRNRPDLRAAQQLDQARAADLHGARAQSQPDLVVEGRHHYTDPTYGSGSVRIGVVFPLFDYGRNRADAAVSEAALREQEANHNETLRVARLDVEIAARTLQQTRQIVESFRNGRLDRSKELLDMAQIGYDRGANSFLELLDAQQVFRSEQTEYARALANYNIARAALERAVGGVLP